MTERRQRLGKRGEAIAARYLRNQGWKILDRNIHFRVAELDIVALEGETVVFVEVRTRWSPGPVRAVDSVRRFKQRKLVLAARLYIQRRGIFDRVCRFDVIGVDGAGGCVRDHIRSAFLGNG